MKKFNNLGSKHVNVTGADQRIYEAKRLSIAQLEQLEFFTDDTFKKVEAHERDGKPIASVFRAGAKQLAELMHHNFPADIAEDLFRFRFPELLDLGFYLAYGEELSLACAHDEKEDEVKKRIDYRFAAAQIMRQFGGYTLPELMQMAHEDFIELHALAIRVQADQTLELVVAGLNAFHRGDIGGLSDRRGSIFRNDGNSVITITKISDEDYESARQIAVEYMANRQPETEIQEFRFDDLKPATF